MTEKEKKCEKTAREVEKILTKELEYREFDEKNRFFILNDNAVLRVTYFILGGEPIVLAEYADNYEQALKYMLDDGDGYSADYFTPEEIAKGIIEEAYL